MKKAISVMLSILIVFSLLIIPAGADESYTVDDGPLIVSVSTTLNAEIRYNIYVALPDSILNDDTAYANFILNTPYEPVFLAKQYVSDVKNTVTSSFGRTVYRFSVKVEPKYFYHTIVFELYGDKNGSLSRFQLFSPTHQFGEGFSYSVARYLDDRYTNSVNTNMKDLALAMLHYGKAAANYFGIETDQTGINASVNLYNILVNRTFLSEKALQEINHFDNNDIEVGTSLELDSSISINLYLKIKNEMHNISDYSVEVDSNQVTPEYYDTQDGYPVYKLKIPNSYAAKELDQMISVDISRGNDLCMVRFCGLSLAYEFIQADRDTDKYKLGAALYYYYSASCKYFDEYVSPYSGLEYSDIDFVSSEEELRQIDGILNRIIIPQMSVLEKIVAVHDWMACNIGYNYANINDPENQNISSALNGSTVCAGYAKLFYVFMKELGIECEYITGTATNSSGTDNHAWDAVLYDGAWYFVDVTWDDPAYPLLEVPTSDLPDGRNIRYKYCMVTAESIAADHTPDSLPLPLGTSDQPHDDALAVGKINSRKRIEARLAAGDPKVGWIMDNEEDYGLALSYLSEHIIDGFNAEKSTCVFSLFGATELSYEVVVAAAESGLAAAKNRDGTHLLVGGYSFGFHSTESDTYIEYIFTFVISTVQDSGIQPDSGTQPGTEEPQPYPSP